MSTETRTGPYGIITQVQGKPLSFLIEVENLPSSGATLAAARIIADCIAKIRAEHDLRHFEKIAMRTNSWDTCNPITTAVLLTAD